MSYSVSLLTTATECDSLLTIAEKEQKDLAYRKTSLNRQKESYSETSTTIDQDLLAVNAEVSALQTIIATLPEGTTKSSNIDKLKRAELKQFFLSKKDKTYGSVSLLSLELDIARVDRELDEILGFITDVNSKKATL